MTFFFDNCLSPALVNILRQLDVDAIHLRERFPPDTPDVAWIPTVGKEGWILITSDLRIRKNSAEHTALHEHRVTALFLQKTFVNRTIWPQAQWLLKNWQKMERSAALLKPGACVKVTDGGSFESL